MTFDPIMVTGNINLCIVQDVSEKSVFQFFHHLNFSKPRSDGNYRIKQLSKPVI